MDNSEKLATQGTQDTRRRQTKQKTKHNMCWTPLCQKKTHTNNVNKTSALLQTTGGKYKQQYIIDNPFIRLSALFT